MYKYRAILEIVDLYFDEFGAGIQTKNVRAKLLENNIYVPPSKLGTYMVTLLNMGYVKRQGTPSTSKTRYFPLRAAI